MFQGYRFHDLRLNRHIPLEDGFFLLICNIWFEILVFVVVKLDLKHLVLNLLF
jgi:hypothetical protein